MRKFRIVQVDNRHYEVEEYAQDTGFFSLLFGWKTWQVVEQQAGNAFYGYYWKPRKFATRALAEHYITTRQDAQAQMLADYNREQRELRQEAATPHIRRVIE